MKHRPPFNQVFDDGYFFLINLLARKLKDGEFDIKNFETIRQLIAKLDGLPYSDKIDLLGMASPDLQRYVSYNQLLPPYERVCIAAIAGTKDLFYYYDAAMPVFLNSEHIIHRYKRARLSNSERADSKITGLTANTVAYAGAIALLFAKILDGFENEYVQRRLLEVDGLPLIIPSAKGFFFAHARRVLPAEQDDCISILRMRQDNRCQIYDPQRSWHPRIHVFINSFLAHADLFKDPAHIAIDTAQDNVVRLFDNIFDSPKMVDALFVMWRNFILPPVDKKNENIPLMQWRALAQHREVEALIPRLEERVRKIFEMTSYQTIFHTHPERKAKGRIVPHSLPRLSCMNDLPTPVLVPPEVRAEVTQPAILPGLGAPYRSAAVAPASLVRTTASPAR